MRRTPILVVLFLLLSPLSLATGESIEIREGEDLQITLPVSANPLYLEPEIFLCRDECEPIEIKSISYNGEEMDFFIAPEGFGDYDLNIFLTINGERISYEKEITIYNGHEKENVKEQIGLTGNIIRNALSPIFGFGLMGLFFVFVFLRMKKYFLFKTGILKFFKSKIEVLFFFVLSFLVFSSVTHEFFHIFTAGLFNCPAVLESFIPVLSPTSVSLKCEITEIQSIGILSAGLIGNLALGALFLLMSLKKKSLVLSTISLAFFFSVFFYLFYTTGDVHNIMKILNLAIPQICLELTGITLISTSFYLFFRRHLKHWNETQVP